jgi:FkbM family methyltransferase
MPGKMARSAPLPPFGLPGVTAVVRAASPACQNAGKAQKFAPLRKSSGEPPIYMNPPLATFKNLLALRDYLVQNPNDAVANFARACALEVGVSKSQLFQDVLVGFLLKGKRNGFFVEFGATNGISLSNTYLLESRLQWKGILAEPARRWHESLKQNRTAAIDNRCVWNKSGESLTFFEADYAELSTISDFRNRDFNKAGREIGITYDVNTVSLNDLLLSHGAPPDIDYMSVDTEGSEFPILNSFDFEKYHVKIVTVEHNYCDPDRKQIFDLLTSKHFVRIFRPFSDFDDWYVQKLVLDELSEKANP